MIAKATSAALIAALGASASGWAATPPITIPSENAPPAVVALGSLADAGPLAVSTDASLAVTVVPSSRGAGRSTVRLGHADGSLQNVEVEGEVLSLAVTPHGDALLAVVRGKDKKGVVRRTDLLRLDLPAARPGIAVGLPTTAQGVAIAAGGGAAIVADKDEVRTFVLPRLTSGPLYRIPGENTLLAPVSGTSRLLLAQGSRLVLVDLAAPQGHEGLAVQEAVDAGSAIRALVTSPDEPLALAAVSDGRLLEVRLDPLRLEPRPAAVAVAWPGVPAAAAPTAPPVAPPTAPPVAPAAAAAATTAAAVAVAAPAATDASKNTVASDTRRPADLEPPPRPAEGAGSAGAPAAAPAAVVGGNSAAAEPSVAAEGAPASSAEPVPAPTPTVAPAAVAGAPASVPAPSVAATAHGPATPGPAGTVTGVLTGAAKGQAAAVVALGPDNVLREAARTAPEGDGSFAFQGLVPGTYRIVATGSKGRVLLCNPPFLTLKVTASGAVQAPSIEVVKAY